MVVLTELASAFLLQRPRKSPKFLFPFQQKKSDFDHSSEYESIDPNLFNRVRAKIRRSQIRRASRAGAASLAHSHSAGGILEGGMPSSAAEDAYHIGRRKSSAVAPTKSFRNYHRMLGAGKRKRSLDSSRLVAPALSQAFTNMALSATAATAEEVEEEGLRGRENEGMALDEEGRKVSNVSSKSNHTYGKISSVPDEDAAVVREVDDDKRESPTEEEETRMMLDRLRNLTHLSTITEQNTPYNTGPSLRPSARHKYPTAEGIFASVNSAADVDSETQATAGSAASSSAASTPTSSLVPPPPPPAATIPGSPLPRRPKSGGGGGGALLKAATSNAAVAAVSSSSSPLPPRRPPSRPITPTQQHHHGGHHHHHLLTGSHSVGETESHAYYPIGSEGSSSHRPTSPRFTVEEVPNYEPILIARSPRTGARVVSSADGAISKRSDGNSRVLTPPPPPPPQATESPALPKRQPVMHKEEVMGSPMAARWSF